jgi:AcrR family transcriptional regulator
MEASPAPGTNVRGRARRRRLLDAAMEAFGEQGFRGTTLGDIAARAGVGESGLLYHFGSKKQLFEEVLGEHDAKDHDRMQRERADPDRSMADALLELAARHEAAPAFIRLYTVVGAESIDEQHPAHDLFVARYRRVRDELAGWAAAEQRKGHITDAIDPEDLARLLIAILDGLELQFLLEHEEDGIAEPLAAFFELLRGPTGTEPAPNA